MWRVGQAEAEAPGDPVAELWLQQNHSESFLKPTPQALKPQ